MYQRTNSLLTFISVMLCIITLNVVIFDLALIYAISKIMAALAEVQSSIPTK